ncbi:MAG: hypothetical protein AAGI27_04365 [Pseudomonadota bacterium]
MNEKTRERDPHDRIDELEKTLKENQVGVLGALRTLLKDYSEYANGNAPFPRSALLGLASAYLRPRIVLVVGSIAAVFIAIAQAYLIVQQNEIIERQAETDRIQAVSQIISSIDFDNPESISRLSPLLDSMGEIGYDTLLAYAQMYDEPWSFDFRSVLADQRNLPKDRTEAASSILIHGVVRDVRRLAGGGDTFRVISRVLDPESSIEAVQQDIDNHSRLIRAVNTFLRESARRHSPENSAYEHSVKRNQLDDLVLMDFIISAIARKNGLGYPEVAVGCPFGVGREEFRSGSGGYVYVEQRSVLAFVASNIDQFRHGVGPRHETHALELASRDVFGFMCANEEPGPFMGAFIDAQLRERDQMRKRSQEPRLLDE